MRWFAATGKSIPYWPCANSFRCPEKDAALAEMIRQEQSKCFHMGQRVYKYENLLKRDFHVETPNSKWVTDISYIKDQTRCIVSVHDPQSVRQQYYVLQDCDTANGEPGAGHYPPGQRAEKRRRSLRSCSSIATKAFNTHPKHISS